MDGQNYLDQISATNRPVKKSKGGIGGILSSKIFLIVAGAVVLFIILAIIGAVLGSNKTDEKSLAYSLKVHLDNTNSAVQEYQSSIKSSKLRSESASLQGVLSNSSKELTDYLVSKYNVKEKDISKDATPDESLKNELFEAKINGVLDRIFAQKMAYEISMFLAEENKIIKSTNNDSLKGLLQTSYDSLSNLYDNFNDFSETK